MCGDEPTGLPTGENILWSAPRGVGMNRALQMQLRKLVGLLHVCGDEPDIADELGTFQPVCPTSMVVNRTVRKVFLWSGTSALREWG